MDIRISPSSSDFIVYALKGSPGSANLWHLVTYEHNFITGSTLPETPEASLGNLYQISLEVKFLFFLLNS